MKKRTDTELDMVAAHKRGVVFYEAHGEKEIQTVLRHARRLYDTHHERDAFVAGYLGTAKRDAKKKSETQPG